jgi:hypothetical protein
MIIKFQLLKQALLIKDKTSAMILADCFLSSFDDNEAVSIIRKFI